MVNNSEIQDRLDLIKIISTSNDTLHSAKLLLDNFCHVQWHTIANFFDDLCNELEYRGYKITDRYDEQTITNIVFGGIQKRKICIEIEVSDERGYTYSIGSDPEDTLFFGLYSDDNKGKINHQSNYNCNQDTLFDVQLLFDSYSVAVYKEAFCNNFRCAEFGSDAVNIGLSDSGNVLVDIGHKLSHKGSLLLTVAD